MGEAKFRRRQTAQFLKANPYCAYCGKKASTVDHCPPRCFFLGRIWPETFDYPSCQQCNDEGRQDEQVMALMVRTRHDIEAETREFSEWSKLADGVKNNSPAVFDELFAPQRGVERKRAFRLAFGKERGDALRLEGGGINYIGPKTAAVMCGFIARLTRSLFFHHLRRTFSGSIYVRHYNLMQMPEHEEIIFSLLSIAPNMVEIQRSGKPLDDQFSYRFSSDPEGSIFFAVIYFQEQFTFHAIATNAATTKALEQDGSEERVRRFGQRVDVDLAPT